MFDRLGEWATALDLTGIVSLPAWALAGFAACLVLVCALVLVRTEGRGVLAVVLLLIVVLTGWWAHDHFARRDLVAELRALDTRAFELAARALVPGSTLGCLDGIAGETAEVACEKALFASPEATAAAVSYVAIQLTLLASASDLERRHGGANARAAMLRHTVEADRFGIVAHVLSVRDGCAPNRCSAFAWLRDPSRINANLAERPFEMRVKTYSASWPGPSGRGVASSTPSPPPGAAAKVPNNLYFPSASSIPPVNIMSAEPPASQRQPQGATGTAESTPPRPPRRPPQADAPARQAPSAAPARSAPTPLAPPQ
jgi:hypothetical protein